MNHCWSCGHERQEEADFCPDCKKVLPLKDHATPFEIFGLPKHFNLDVSALEVRFYELSRKFHPDFFQRRSAEELDISLKRTAALNLAYQTLKDPLKRAYYLVKLYHLDKTDPTNGQMSRFSKELALEFFDLQEQIAEIEASKQAGTQTWKVLEADFNARIQKFKDALIAIDQDIKSFFVRCDEALQETEKEQIARLLKECLDHRAYLNRFILEIDFLGKER